MNAPDGESPTFAHRVVRWLAIVTLGYGLLNILGLGITIRYDSIWAVRSWLGGSRQAAFGYMVLMACLVALEVIGAIELLRWKSRGRILLLAWSISAMLITFATMVVSVWVYTRAVAATTQRSYQPQMGYMVWNWFHYWLQGCALPLVLLIILLQGDVKKIWAGRRAGGFDVIPMAATAEQT
jgi:hypothetical protein